MFRHLREANKTERNTRACDDPLPKKLTYDTVTGIFFLQLKPQKRIRSKLLRPCETAGVLTSCSVTNLRRGDSGVSHLQGFSLLRSCAYPGNGQPSPTKRALAKALRLKALLNRDPTDDRQVDRVGPGPIWGPSGRWAIPAVSHIVGYFLEPVWIKMTDGKLRQ